MKELIIAALVPRRSAQRGSLHIILLRLSLGVLLLLQVPQFSQAALPCQTTQQCEETLRPGSECVDNKCTNPYHAGGCLKNRIKGWTKTRVCHSDDPPDAETNGHCIAPDPNFQYEEIRILAQNWESVFFQVSTNVYCMR